MKPHIFHPDAGAEYTSAVQYYADIAPELGTVSTTKSSGSSTRFAASRNVSFASARRPNALARKFPYSVVYLNQPDHVWIVAIMHAKRRPGYWRERLG